MPATPALRGISDQRHDQLGTVADPELAEHVLQVGLDGGPNYIFVDDFA